jgi:hypothetical protein
MNWRPALAGVLAVGAIVTIGVATLDNTSSVATPAASTAPSASASPSALPTPPAMSTAPAATPAMPAPIMPAMVAPQGPLPVSISIPAIGVAAQLGKPLGLNPDGTVEVPDVATPNVPGWYSLGARPGDEGNSVIIAHVDGGGGQLGLFHDLPRLIKGDLIKVGREDGTTVTFAVTNVQIINKTKLPSDLVYGPTTGSYLNLATCGGPFDKASGNYLDSVITYSTLVK